MNRLAPLIRRPAAVAIPFPSQQGGLGEASALLDDLRFFATVWVGGLVFFGTLFA